MDREKIIQDILNEVSYDALGQAASVGAAAMPVTMIAGMVAGAGYNKAKGKYYKFRHRLAKRGNKGKWTNKVQANKRKGATHMMRGMVTGLVAPTAVPMVGIGIKDFKKSKPYQAAAWKAGRHKRRAGNIGKSGFDARGFKIVPRKPPKIHGALPSGVKEETNKPERVKLDKVKLDRPKYHKADGTYGPLDMSKPESKVKKILKRLKLSEVFLYGGVGQLRRSAYGPRTKRGSRVRSMFPPRILSTQDRTKSRFSASVRLKALEAFRKQTRFPHKPLAQPAVPIRLREAYKHKLASRDRALAKCGMAPALDQKAFGKAIKRHIISSYKREKGIGYISKISKSADRYSGKHYDSPEAWIGEAKMKKKSRLQRRLETSAKGRPAKTRQVAQNKQARRGYKWRMRASRAKYALGGATKGAVIGGAIGGALNVSAWKNPAVDKRITAVIGNRETMPIGMAIGAGLGALHGTRKAGKSWHKSRRHGKAVDKSYASLADRQYKRRRKQSMQEDYRKEVIEALAESFRAKSVMKKVDKAARGNPEVAGHVAGWAIGGAAAGAKALHRAQKNKSLARRKGGVNFANPKVKLKKKQSEHIKVMRAMRHLEVRDKGVRLSNEEIIDALAEVFDDTYGKTITRSAKDQKGKEIVHKARSLKANKAMAKIRFMTDKSKRKMYARDVQRAANKYGKTA